MKEPDKRTNNTNTYCTKLSLCVCVCVYVYDFIDEGLISGFYKHIPPSFTFVCLCGELVVDFCLFVVQPASTADAGGEM